MVLCQVVIQWIPFSIPSMDGVAIRYSTVCTLERFNGSIAGGDDEKERRKVEGCRMEGKQIAKDNK